VFYFDFLGTSQEIGLEECPQNELFCVASDVKPQLNQLEARYFIVSSTCYWDDALMTAGNILPTVPETSSSIGFDQTTAFHLMIRLCLGDAAVLVPVFPQQINLPLI